MVVDVQNGNKRAQEFVAKGLFFVPQGDPGHAPQRLGAAGPFQVEGTPTSQHQQTITIQPGKTTRLELQVFCLDSHRSSPGASQAFRVAKSRLPKELRREISAGTGKILFKSNGNVDAAKSAIQSHVWNSRNKKWIKIEGERNNERSTNRQGNDDRRQQRRNEGPLIER
jgi:hypothetical protein